MDGIETPRLRFRVLTRSDRALHASLYGDARVMAHVGAPLSGAGLDAAFDAACRSQHPVARLWVAEVRSSGADAGLLAVFPHGDTAEIGVMLLPGCQRLGYAGEIFARAVPWAFRERGLGMLWARHAAGHGRAGATVERAGFERMPAGLGSPGWTTWRLSRARWDRLAATA